MFWQHLSRLRECWRANSPAHTPEGVLEAIDRISRHTQEGVLIPWLPRLLRTGDMPIISAQEAREGEHRGMHFYQDAEYLRAYFARSIQATPLAYPSSIQVLERVIADYRRSPTPPLSSWIMGGALLAFLTHVLEGLWPGLGKFVCVSAESCWREGRETHALYRAGMPTVYLKGRWLRVLVLLLLAGILILWSEHVFQAGKFIMAGGLFGLAVVVPSRMERFLVVWQIAWRRLRDLERAGKIQRHDGYILRLAWEEGFPTRASRLENLALLFVPACAAGVFAYAPFLATNGLLFAVLVSIEPVCRALFPRLVEIYDNRRIRDASSRGKTSAAL